MENENLIQYVFWGMIPIGDTGVIVAGGLSEIQRMVEAGEMSQPEGYFPPSDKITELVEKRNSDNDDRK